MRATDLTTALEPRTTCPQQFDVSDGEDGSLVEAAGTRLTNGSGDKLRGINGVKVILAGSVDVNISASIPNGKVRQLEEACVVRNGDALNGRLTNGFSDGQKGSNGASEGHNGTTGHKLTNGYKSRDVADGKSTTVVTNGHKLPNGIDEGQMNGGMDVMHKSTCEVDTEHGNTSEVMTGLKKTNGLTEGDKLTNGVGVTQKITNGISESPPNVNGVLADEKILNTVAGDSPKLTNGTREDPKLTSDLTEGISLMNGTNKGPLTSETNGEPKLTNGESKLTNGVSEGMKLANGTKEGPKLRNGTNDGQQVTNGTKEGSQLKSGLKETSKLPDVQRGDEEGQHTLGHVLDWDRTVAGVKEQAFAKLQEELQRAHQELRLRDEEVTRLSRIREEVEAELEDLTASLFQEAHNMVREANVRQAAAERALKESQMQVEVLTAEVSALKTLVLTSTPSRPNPHLHPQIDPRSSRSKDDASVAGGGLFARKHRRSPSHFNLKYGRENSPPDSPVKEQRLAVSEPVVPEAKDGWEVDPNVHKEFVTWKQNPQMDKSDTFIARVYSEDIDMCLDFNNQELAARVSAAVEAGNIFIEAVGDKSKNIFPKKCALLEAPRQCHYRMKLGDEEQWYCISQICRNRIIAVCDFLNYLRYIQRGLVKSSVHDVYWEITRLRKEMVLARLGLALSS